MRFILGYIFLFLFIYNVPFRSVPLGTGKLISLISLLFIFIKRYSNNKYHINRNILYFLQLLVIMFSYSLLISLVYNTLDFAIPKRYIEHVLEYFIGGIVIFYTFKTGQISCFSDFLLKIVNIQTVQACIIILMMVSGTFREVISGVMRTELFKNVNGQRGFGLAGDVFYGLSVFQSLGLISIAVLLFNNNKRLKLPTLALKYILITVSVILSSRTGYLGLAISLVIIFYQTIKIKSFRFKTKNVKRAIWFLFGIVISSAASIAFILLIISDKLKKVLYVQILPWAFEMFINFHDKGNLETSSSNVLKSMYFPVSVKTFFFGDGKYFNPDGSYYMHTDAGYMRMMLYYGVIGSLFHYLFILLVVRKTYLKLESLKTDGSLNLRIFFISLALYFFAVHIKGDLLIAGNMSLKFIYLLFLYSLFQQRIEGKLKCIKKY